jgi:O-methyltransferase
MISYGVTVEGTLEARVAAARAGFEAAREIQVRGPAPGEESLRAAYLELLKLCLCDLAGSTTTSVGRNTDGTVMARELEGEQLRLRSAGMDWPLHGLTMVGLRRLDDLQACVESAVWDGVEGDLIEAGAWRGGASIMMRATLDSLGARERTVWVADSFQGFPLSEAKDDLGVFDFLAIPADEVLTSFTRLGLRDGVRLVPGYFDQTLPGLAGQSWSVVRLDADTYETTLLALRCLYPGLAVGGYLIVDDFGALEECQAAVEDFRRDHRITEPLKRVDWTCVRWRRESEQLTAPLGDLPSVGGRRARTARRPAREHVPTVQELALSRELEEVTRRLEQAQAELRLVRRTAVTKLRDRVASRFR